MLRHSIGRRPQLTFTSDFHELVQGDLTPGPCVLRYDPLRLLAADNSNERHEIRVWLRFHPSGGSWQGSLLVPENSHLKDLADPAAQGFMVETPFPLPPGCEEIEAWFCCEHHGRADWDSDHGNNFWLRFALHDLKIGAAQVRPAPSAAGSSFELQVDSTAAVEALDVRWRLPAQPEEGRRTHSMAVIGRSGGRKQWRNTVPIGVPKDAAVVFDLVYRVSGREFTDDNQGRWYLAD
jgi:hypothetical protein